MNHAGYLTKLGARVKNWKRRWFVISGTVLSYYKTPRDKVPKGRIDLETATVKEADGETEKEYSISVALGDGSRTYYMYASTPDEKERWIEAMQKAKISYWRQLAQTAEQGRLQAESERESLHHELVDASQTRDRLASDLVKLRHYVGSSNEKRGGPNGGGEYDAARYESDSSDEDISTINLYGTGSGLLTQPIPADSSRVSSVVLEGWMTKRGEKRKSWLKRWFRLERHAESHLPQLFYFKNEKASKKSPLGHIDILSYSVAEDPSHGRDYCIALRNSFVTDARAFYLCAPDLSSLRKWIRAIHDTKTQFYHARLAIEKSEYESQMSSIRNRIDSSASRNPPQFRT